MSSYQITVQIGMSEVTFDTKDGLLIVGSSDEGSWMSLQEARELLGFLRDNLEEPEHARSTLRPFLDRPTEGG